MEDRTQNYVAGLGGLDNIREVESCITRIRVEINEPSLVNADLLRAAGAFGVVKQGGVVQVIVGDVSDEIVADIEAALGAQSGAGNENAE